MTRKTFFTGNEIRIKETASLYLKKEKVNKMSKEKILSAKDLSKTFSNESVQQHVLKNLNLDVYKGDFTVVMGNSGSGKSTLLYALSGMDKPTLGQVIFSGEDITGMSSDKLAVFRRTHCGFVFQSIYLLDSMNVFDNIFNEVCNVLSEDGDSEYIHTLSNMALLKKNDNAALNNSTFDVKRNKIVEMDQKGAFIPYCTKMVFLKYYTPSNDNQVHFWGKKDRDAYLAAMAKVLKPYLTIINKSL